jgi:uncharacterized protein
MSLQEQLEADLRTAMKQREKLKVSLLRMLKSELKYAKIEKGRDLDEAEVLDLLTRYARKRKESALEYEKGGRDDLVTKELAEHDMVQAYLPRALDEAELSELVTAAVNELEASSMKDMGRVMKLVLERAAGRADGAAVSALVKSHLSA